MNRASKWRWIGGVTIFAVGLAWVGLGYLEQRVYEDLPKPLLGPLEPLPTIGSLSSRQCRSCHPTIYAEWASSYHGKAVTDPLYQADLKSQGSPYFCDYCHAPLGEQRAAVVSGLESIIPDLKPTEIANARYQANLHEEGIMCVACHQQDGAMIGPIQTSSAPHPTRQTSQLRDPTFCEPCHQLDFKFVGQLERPIADTMAEWREYRALGGTKVCIDCHMPKTATRSAALGAVARPGTSHQLLGAFDREFVSSALGIKTRWALKSRENGVKAVVQLTNQTGHRLPTAEPHRRIDVILKVLNSKGEPLARRVYAIERNLDVHRLREEPGKDNTLGPLEKREIVLVLEPPLPQNTATAQVSIEFVVWEANSPVAKAAGLEKSALTHHLRIIDTRISP